MLILNFIVFVIFQNRSYGMHETCMNFIMNVFPIHPYAGFFGSLYVSGKLPTYPSPKPTSTLISHLRQNVGSGEG